MGIAGLDCVLTAASLRYGTLPAFLLIVWVELAVSALLLAAAVRVPARKLG
ncbi:MAG: hypothetical protein HY319_09650 [Armatimonadetes bacterium]|nr:hypothetical protein [Armatimonadota bacterium]